MCAGLALALAGPACASPEPEPLRAAIEDLSLTFGSRYPQGPEYLARWQELSAAAARARGEGAKAVAAQYEALRREALLANPLVRGQTLLFVSRPQYLNTHGAEETMYQTGEICTDLFRGGGSLRVLELARGGVVKTLLNLPAGIARDPDVSFDGKRLLFSMRRDRADDYHLYEMNRDGSHLRQLTFAARVSDIRPIYLPDGRILFSSTREPKYIPCQRHLMANLFVMEADGANIRQIGHNTQFEGRASLLPDGRVLYTRWEYVDKHFSSAYGLWAANPDGTAQRLFYGGCAWQPGAILDARAIPGSRKVACIFTSVHDLDWGALVVVDPDRGNDGPQTVARSWPRDISGYLSQWNVVGRVSGGSYDSFGNVPLKYGAPYPLSEKYFLCSRMVATTNQQMAMFLVDVFGNEVLLHQEAAGCFEPMPLAPRVTPPVIAETTDLAQEEGTFYILDVYRGAKMEGIPRGTIKALRVVEAPAKLTYPLNGIGDWSAPGDGESHHPTAVNWNHYNTKCVLGTVPVEPDGSANFHAPAGRFLYFQLLDENGMMVQSMRSGTTLQPGERAGCVGCHEYGSAPTAGRPPRALQRSPDRLQPWHGPARNFNYAAEVQPVLDRHCVRCHDYGKEAGQQLNLSSDQGLVFNASYVALMGHSPALWTLPGPKEAKPLVSTVGSGPVPEVPPRTWGAYRSRLIEVLRTGHHEVKLSPEDLDRLITWIDLNAPYYPDYADYYTANTYGRSPLDHQQLLRLGQCVLGAPGGKAWGWNSVNDYIGGDAPPGSLMGRGELPVNFTRPERSACLRVFADQASAGYTEALTLIESGGRLLRQHPRADMPGFKPCPADQERLDYYAARRQIEEGNRRAILAGRKSYDQQQ